jgi:biotin-dependent carboxylase-like uncharacterized protein
MIEIVRIGGYATIQDRGRFGTRKIGLPSGGFMDRQSANQANMLLGNDPNASLIELFYGDIVLKSHAKCKMAITGALATIEVKGDQLRSPCVVSVEKQETIKIHKIARGNILYLGFNKEIDTTRSFGSSSTYTIGKLGGNYGQKIKAGNVFRLGKENQIYTSNGKRHFFIANDLSVRFRKGPEYDMIERDSRGIMLSESFLVSKINRVGYRLMGRSIQHKVIKMSSRFVTRGTIQLPPGGKMIVMMSDAQTTGGYPRIGQLYEPDIDAFAQMPVGSSIRFRLIL